MLVQFVCQVLPEICQTLAQVTNNWQCNTKSVEVSHRIDGHATGVAVDRHRIVGGMFADICY